MEFDGNVVYLLLGNNLGDRRAILQAAMAKIALQIGEIRRQSSFYETAAWGKQNQPSFLNIALAVETFLTPMQVLEKCLDIEEQLGRVRAEKWGARLIDIDILLFGNQVVDISDRLQIPHPEMQNRRFVLEPLAEIADDIVHPIMKKTIFELLDHLNDDLTVSKT